MHRRSSPLFIAEPESDRVRGWLAEDHHVITWAWTRTEIISAIERRTRDGSLPRTQRREVARTFSKTLAGNWDEVTDILAVRLRARRVLARHPLRAADAGQLGAALLVQEQLAEPLTFICPDARLASAAELEGLRVLP